MNKNLQIAQMRLRVLEYAKKIGNVRATCLYFGVSKSTFYSWKARFEKEGEAGLVNKPPIARNHPREPLIYSNTVIPAKAGIYNALIYKHWIPDLHCVPSGMTNRSEIP